MFQKSFKCLLVLVLTSFLLTNSYNVIAQDSPKTEIESKEQEGYDAGKSIINHVLDAHMFHVFSFGRSHFGLPLPLILYSQEKGFVVFNSSTLAEKMEEAKEKGENFTGYKGFSFSDEEGGSLIAVNPDGSKKDNAIIYASLLSLKDKVPAGGEKIYDISVTKGTAQLVFASIILVIVMLFVAKKYKNTGSKIAPSGFQNAIEPIIVFVRDDVAKQYLGKHYEKYMPFLLTIFFFILINNLLGLIPGSANVSGNIGFTFVLALIALVVILISTTGKFWGHVFWFPGVPVLVKIIMIPVELLGLIIRPAALMIRLFANMTAGHIVILSFVSLIFIFGHMSPVAGYGFSPVSIIFVIFMDCVELLVAFIQAFIFTNLTAVFISQSIIEDDHH